VLQDLEGDCNDLGVSGVQSGLDWDNQLGNDGEYFGSSFLEHVTDSLDGKETVGIILFTDSLKEDGKVMMVIELRNIDFPVDFVLGSVLNGNGQISTVVESSEFTWGNDT